MPPTERPEGPESTTEGRSGDDDTIRQAGWVGPGDPGWVCPECPHCEGQPDCDDCLDCMTPGGAARVEAELAARPASRVVRSGRSEPLRADELAARRAALDVTAQLALAVRDARGQLGLSQRDLAALLGWSKSRLARFESHPGQATLRDAAEVLARCGLELAILEDGAPLAATRWGTPELLARDSAGRRYPPQAELTAGPGDPSGHRRGPDGTYRLLDWRWHHRRPPAAKSEVGD